MFTIKKSSNGQQARMILGINKESWLGKKKSANGQSLPPLAHQGKKEPVAN
jgi:hypothetical protein